jgi:molybdopterin-guanine dinucleotide biosynthesis protein A
MDELDAVILAAGRLPVHEARRIGVEIKALVRVGETTALETVVRAMRTSRAVRRVIVVGPRELHGSVAAVDVWLDERQSGEENVLAGLGAAQTRRAVVSASDVPFVHAAHVDDFLRRVPDDADFAYPVYERGEFLESFPRGRSKFARVGTTHYTGGSVCLMTVALALRNASLIRRGFAARKSQIAMASLLGVEGVVRFATGSLDITHVERRIGQITGGRVVAIRGAHPALAMDYDDALDIEYVRDRTGDADEEG